MKELLGTMSLGTIGLILNEPLLWERVKKGRLGFSLPKRDVGSCDLSEELVGETLDFPELSEVDVVRHYTRLSTWNFGVDTGMYTLGSCTMKYNPKTNERQASLAGFAGAHGEFAGMLMVHAYHQNKGKQRTKILAPNTAHGTNPASVALCGFHSIPVTSNEEGVLSADAVAALMDEDTAGIIITNPNTLGLFEENIKKIAEVVRAKCGIVYCDGANMNAVMGIVSVGVIGVDVLHLNLHKTFSTPRGGGDPGSGPICVKNIWNNFSPFHGLLKKAASIRCLIIFPHQLAGCTSFMEMSA